MKLPIALLAGAIVMASTAGAQAHGWRGYRAAVGPYGGVYAVRGGCWAGRCVGVRRVIGPYGRRVVRLGGVRYGYPRARAFVRGYRFARYW